VLIDGIVLGDHTVVIDGAKALTSAIHTVFGTLGAIQRCQLHKRRNILGHLPDHLHANVTAVLREAWAAVAVALAQRHDGRPLGERAIVEAEKKFRRVHGWQDITKVVSALGHLEAKEGASTERVA